VALQGLTLDVALGELLVVFGPSGSGKSTLLRILAGLDRPSAGSVSVFGHDLRTLRGRGLVEYRSRTLGYADQHYGRALAPELSARQLVALRLALLGVERAERERVADSLLERVGLLDRADALPRELSGGQQQRVAICAALAHRPRLFIADEPTGELDAANAEQIYALIGALSREVGATTLVVSHDPSSAAVADRVVQIRDGRVSAEDGEAVVNRGGWVRIPEELLSGASRAHVDRVPEGIILRVHERPAAPAPVEPDAVRGDVVVRTVGLTKLYGDAPVFRDLSIELESGRLSAVTGPSGSGKSTLLHLLAGLDLPTAGEVHVLDAAISQLDATERAHRSRDPGHRPRPVPHRTGERRARARHARRADDECDPDARIRRTRGAGAAACLASLDGRAPARRCRARTRRAAQASPCRRADGTPRRSKCAGGWCALRRARRDHRRRDRVCHARSRDD